MADEKNSILNASPATTAAPSGGGMGKMIAMGVAGVFVLVIGYLMIDVRSKVGDLEQKQADYQQKTDQRLAADESRQKATADTLGSQVGMTQQQLVEKTAALQKSEHAAVSKLTEQQKQALSAVNAEVSGVKTDVASTKTDVASTKTDLEATKAKLERTIGDLGLQSGLIAHTRDELEVLKHRGDRNYYDFTLLRGKSPTPVSTISLQLKKVDPKKNRFTLNVVADDKTIEKKDRNIEEPLQFYTGKEHMLYELVVFTVDKSKVTGYLTTPKDAPQPVSQ